jgi:uncharacterized protein YcnI
MRIIERNVALNRNVVAFAGLVAALSCEASAHVVLDKPEARIGAPYKAMLAVAHGCEGSATVRLTVSIPEGMIAVKPIPKPGWTIKITKGAYARSYAFMHGIQLAEGVKEISWSGGKLDDDFYDEFGFAGFIADSLKSGERLAFPAIQECETGVSKWIEVAAAGQDPHALKFPAPLLRLAGAESSRDVVKDDISISAPWSRATPGGARVGGGYLSIRNSGKEADRLIAVSSAVATSVDVHEMTMKDGVMTMRPVEGGLVIAPGQTVVLSPGGFHLMLMGLKEPLQQGHAVGITLEFEKAGKVAVDLDVLGVGAQGPAAPATAGVGGEGGHEHMNH